MSVLSSIFIVTCLGGLILSSRADEDINETPWTESRARCHHRVQLLNSVPEFLEFANELDLPTEPKQAQPQITKTINDCLHSIDGEGDIRAMDKIVKQLRTIHSVCESVFIDQLFKFTKRMRDNGISGKNSKRTSSHGLLRFYSLLTGQVILTCKKNLEKKLEQAEQSDETLIRSLDVVENDNSIRPSVESITPNLRVDLPENIVLTAAIRARSKVGLYVPLTLDSKEMVEKFSRVKRACKLIESYAQSSIHPMTRFAMVGLKAGDEDDVTDKKLKSSPRVTKWLSVVQYCQGFALIKAIPHCAVPESMSHDLSDEEQAKPELKRFEVDDRIDDIGLDMHCSVHSMDPKARKMKSWVMRRTDTSEPASPASDKK